MGGKRKKVRYRLHGSFKHTGGCSSYVAGDRRVGRHHLGKRVAKDNSSIRVYDGGGHAGRHRTLADRVQILPHTMSMCTFFAHAI